MIFTIHPDKQVYWKRDLPCNKLYTASSHIELNPATVSGLMHSFSEFKKDNIS